MGGGLKMDGQNVVSISYGWSVALAGRDNVGGLVTSPIYRTRSYRAQSGPKIWSR